MPACRSISRFATQVEPSTRHTIAIAQVLFSALLIDLTGGRIETHFHVFGSLAFLAVYGDWPVLIPATMVVAIDHFVRGVYLPQSVYGVLVASPWRWLEHSGWVIFEDTVLIFSCRQSVSELQRRGPAHRGTGRAHARTRAGPAIESSDLGRRLGCGRHHR